MAVAVGMGITGTAAPDGGGGPGDGRSTGAPGVTHITGATHIIGATPIITGAIRLMAVIRIPETIIIIPMPHILIPIINCEPALNIQSGQMRPKCAIFVPVRR